LGITKLFSLNRQLTPLQEFSYYRPVTFSQRQSNAVVQLDEHIAIQRQMKLIYVIKINYHIPMYAEKSFWIQH